MVLTANMQFLIVNLKDSNSHPAPMLIVHNVKLPAAKTPPIRLVATPSA